MQGAKRNEVKHGVYTKFVSGNKGDLIFYLLLKHFLVFDKPYLFTFHVNSIFFAISFSWSSSLRRGPP